MNNLLSMKTTTELRDYWFNIVSSNSPGLKSIHVKAHEDYKRFDADFVRLSSVRDPSILRAAMGGRDVVTAVLFSPAVMDGEKVVTPEIPAVSEVFAAGPTLAQVMELIYGLKAGEELYLQMLAVGNATAGPRIDALNKFCA